MNKTVTFETAKRLYDLGMRIKTDSSYRDEVDNKTLLRWDVARFERSVIPAPDAQELLDAMLAEIKYNGVTYLLTLVKTFDNRINNKHYSASYHCFDCDEEWEESEHTHINNPSEALAEMLIWLVENKYITVEEINGGL